MKEYKIDKSYETLNYDAVSRANLKPCTLSPPPSDSIIASSMIASSSRSNELLISRLVEGNKCNHKLAAFTAICVRFSLDVWYTISPNALT